MDNKIPAGQNNPLNYFENWAKAYEAIGKSMHGGKGEKGFMEYQDFYNIINELNNMLALTHQSMKLGKDIEGNAMYLDGSLESAAALIERGAGAMKITADKKMKVDLSGIGIDFAASADEMNKNVDAGIDAVADA